MILPPFFIRAAPRRALSSPSPLSWHGVMSSCLFLCLSFDRVLRWRWFFVWWYGSECEVFEVLRPRTPALIGCGRGVYR